MVFRQLLVAAMCLLLVACAGIEPKRDPVRVSVSGIQVQESTLLEQLYLVTLRIQNHEPDAITINGGSFDLEINGRDFGSGVTDQTVTVPGYSDAKVEVRMVSTVFGVLRLIQGMRERTDQTLQWQISGSLSLEGTLTGLSFTEAGEISLPDRGPEPAAK